MLVERGNLLSGDSRLLGLQMAVRELDRGQSGHRPVMGRIDGDACLKHENILSKLNEVYDSAEIWLTYGAHEIASTGGRADWAYEYPEVVVEGNSYRDYDWLVTQLRTFRKELFLKTDEIDRMTDGR